MTAVLRVAASALALVVLAGAAAPAKEPPPPPDPEKVARKCAKAEKRYQKLFGDQQVPDGTEVVITYKYTFCPPQLTVKTGTTVRWVNVDKRTSHSVWLKESGRAESERLFESDMFEVTFENPGKFPYLCGPHWEQDGMVGVVTVTDD